MVICWAKYSAALYCYSVRFQNYIAFRGDGGDRRGLSRTDRKSLSTALYSTVPCISIHILYVKCTLRV